MTPEGGFMYGLPLLNSLPLEVREKLVKAAKDAPSASAAIKRASAEIALIPLPGINQIQRERITKTIRWLALIRLSNPNKPEIFQNAVNMVLPANSTSTASKATGKEE